MKFRIVPENLVFAILSGAYTIFWWFTLFIWIIPLVDVPFTAFVNLTFLQIIAIMAFLTIGAVAMVLAAITFIICLKYITY